jgi:hypothetical protein
VFDVIPFFGAALALGYLLYSATNETIRIAWQVPAAVCGLFLAWSLFAVVTEGPLGF